MSAFTPLLQSDRSGNLARRVLWLALLLFVTSQFLPKSSVLQAGWFFSGFVAISNEVLDGTVTWGPNTGRFLRGLLLQAAILAIFTLAPWGVALLSRARIFAWVLGVLMALCAADMVRFVFGVKIPGTSDTFRLVYSWGGWTFIAALAVSSIGLFLIPKARPPRDQSHQ